MQDALFTDRHPTDMIWNRIEFRMQRSHLADMAHNHDHRPVRIASRNWSGPWAKTPGRLLGTGFVRLYQLTLSGFIGNSCRHFPTCSEYAYESIARHGLWAGGWMGAFRVARCGPGGTHGIDLVPETLDRRYRWYTPWRYWAIGRAKPGSAVH